jgi:hypothetical protein
MTKTQILSIFNGILISVITFLYIINFGLTPDKTPTNINTNHDPIPVKEPPSTNEAITYDGGKVTSVDFPPKGWDQGPQTIIKTDRTIFSISGNYPFEIGIHVYIKTNKNRIIITNGVKQHTVTSGDADDYFFLMGKQTLKTTDNMTQ